MIYKNNEIHLFIKYIVYYYFILYIFVIYYLLFLHILYIYIYYNNDVSKLSFKKHSKN